VANEKSKPESLKGWTAIASFLGQPITVAQRWAESGMPVQQKGRYVYASPKELTHWLGWDAGGGPVRIPSERGDLSSDLKRGLSHVRKHRPPQRTKKKNVG
jgi:hypothetical protein